MTNLANVIAQMKTLFTDQIEASLIPEGFLCMNAPRPLMGTDADTDAFLHGRFSVLLDEKDPYSVMWAEGNRKLDAYIVLVATRDQQMEMALFNKKYAAEYLKMNTEDRWDCLSSQISKIQRLPYEQALALFAAVTDSQRAAA